MNPNILELKTYVPAKHFEESKRFYSELGFTLTEAWGGSVDCELGGAQFRLQNYYNKDWAENFMMQFWVTDIQEWYNFAKPNHRKRTACECPHMGAGAGRRRY